MDILTNTLGDILGETLVIIVVMLLKESRKQKKITNSPSRLVISVNVLFQMLYPFGLIKLAIEALSVGALGVS